MRVFVLTNYYNISFYKAVAVYFSCHLRTLVNMLWIAAGTTLARSVGKQNRQTLTWSVSMIVSKEKKKEISYLKPYIASYKMQVHFPKRHRNSSSFYGCLTSTVYIPAGSMPLTLTPSVFMNSWATFQLSWRCNFTLGLWLYLGDFFPEACYIHGGEWGHYDCSAMNTQCYLCLPQVLLSWALHLRESLRCPQHVWHLVAARSTMTDSAVKQKEKPMIHAK